jgi:sugar phosphate isomerase/epimerase
MRLFSAPGGKRQSKHRGKNRRMALKNRLGGHTNSYHTYSLEEALEGIAAAGYRYVELTAVRGWTEHVPLDADAKALGGIQRMLRTSATITATNPACVA